MSLLDHPSVSHLREAPAEPSTGSEGAATLVVRPWWDPTLAISGHLPTSDYTERYWLGILGPSVICLLRRFTRGFEEHPRGFQVSMSDTARAIGLGGGTGKNSPINRTIDRACTFNMARRTPTDGLEVRLHLPSLTPRQVSRLPAPVRKAHDDWVAANTPVGPPPTAPRAA